jgi:hypothetical protein
MLRRVTSPPFGNTIYDATIPSSVTFIMSQFAALPFEAKVCYNLNIMRAETAPSTYISAIEFIRPHHFFVSKVASRLWSIAPL